MMQCFHVAHLGCSGILQLLRQLVHLLVGLLQLHLQLCMLLLEAPASHVKYRGGRCGECIAVTSMPMPMRSWTKS